jgi:hypothetical protein
VPAAGQYSFDNYLTAVHITKKDWQYNFEFKDGQKTDQPVAYDYVLNRTLIDHDGNQIKKIVKWYHPNEGFISQGLQFFNKQGQLLAQSNPGNFTSSQRKQEIELETGERVLGFKGASNRHGSAYYYDIQFVIGRIEKKVECFLF